MRAPSFWWKPPGFMAKLLSPVSALYEIAVKIRLKKPGEKAGLPVICIGNPVVGGAGKTPVAIAVAKWLMASGRRPVFLSRGYGGRLTGPLLVDQVRHTSTDCGDEPLLLAQTAPVIVSRDRVRGALMAADFGDCIVMDDGLQNPSLRKDFTLAVIDGENCFGNGYSLPAGPLRAPLSVQWPLIDAILMIGESRTGLESGAFPPDIPVFSGHITPEATEIARFKGHAVLAFAGIGRPSKFFNSLRDCGALIKEQREFADHHPYSREELEQIVTRCRDAHWTPVTTAKDFVRIQSRFPELADHIAVLNITVSIEHFDRLATLIVQKALSRF